MASSKTLVWRGSASSADMQPNLFEGIALAAVLPGTLLTVGATGLSANAVAATVFSGKPIFANRDVMRQKNMDAAWVLNDSMQAVEFRSGEFGCVRVATGQAIAARRTPLSSNGDGTLKIAVTDGTEQILCYSDEIITTTAVTLVNVYF
jgi:hypothetical protein